MYKELKIRFKETEDKEKYQDIVYELRKHYRGKLDSEIVVKALEQHLRTLNCEVSDDN